VFDIENTAYTDARKTHYTIPVYTTVFLKMNPRFRNMYKTNYIDIIISQNTTQFYAQYV